MHLLLAKPSLLTLKSYFLQMVRINLSSKGLYLDIRGKGRVAGELIISERKTVYGTAVSLFGNMQHTHNSTTIKPRKDVHLWNHDKVQYGGQNYNYNGYLNNEIYFETKDEEETQKKDTSTGRKVWTKTCNMWDDFCAKSNLHGMQFLNSREFNRYERIFWLISILVASGFGAYFIMLVWIKYDEGPVIISFNPILTPMDQIPFPSITICNVNMATKTKAHRILKFGSDVDKRLLNDMCNLNNSFTNMSGADATADWKTVRSFILSVNQKCSDMFKLCKWENKPVSCELYINSILTDEGYCCSFNRVPSNYSLRDVVPGDLNETYPGTRVDWNPEDGYPANAKSDVYPLKATGSGVHLGLTIVLDAGLDEYYCTSTSSVGFKVILSNPIDTPKVAEYGFLLKPGVETRIPIEPSIIESSMGIKNIDVEKRQCFFARERKLQFYRIYTERNCRLECQAIYTLKKCGCVPYFLPKNASTKVCDKRKEQCSNEAKFTIEKLSTPERMACNCLPGCFAISYRSRLISESYLTTHYRIADEDLLEREAMEYFSDNLVVAHFYYESDRFRVEIISELYGFADFLSNIGGLLGIFLGFGVLSVVEFFYYLLVKGFFKHKGRKDDP